MANTTKKSKKTFVIMVDIKGQFNMEVAADSLEDALIYAKSLTSLHMMKKIPEITRNDSWNDFEHNITGVYFYD